MDSDIVLARYAELKNKLREGLKVELREISGEGDGAGGPRKSVKNVQDASEKKPPKAATAEKRPPKVDTTDYFELVYECIHTRASFLNVISLNSLSSVEPDIDLAILQALLKGNKNINIIFLINRKLFLQLRSVLIRIRQVINENVNNFI
jgi:hypothetical protein